MNIQINPVIKSYEGDCYTEKAYNFTKAVNDCLDNQITIYSIVYKFMIETYGIDNLKAMMQGQTLKQMPCAVRLKITSHSAL